MSQAVSLPTSCQLCPRRCGADRAAGERGSCGADDTLRVARAALHYWEEPPISGTRGSGAVFFSGCPLRCVFCQNADISRGLSGKEISVGRLGEIYLELQEQGARNINLVTPTHYLPQVCAALDAARESGLSLPVVCNTSGYETEETIRSLEGHVDVYLTDFKYASPMLAQRYSNAADYPEVAWKALAAMYEQVGPYTTDERADTDEPDALVRGVVVRHLMLPGHLLDSQTVIRRVFNAYGNSVCYSLMSQYTPFGELAGFPELQHTINEDEYDRLIDFALDLGVTNSFMQEGSAASESFIPPFDNTGV